MDRLSLDEMTESEFVTCGSQVKGTRGRGGARCGKIDLRKSVGEQKDDLLRRTWRLRANVNGSGAALAAVIE